MNRRNFLKGFASALALVPLAPKTLTEQARPIPLDDSGWVSFGTTPPILLNDSGRCDIGTAAPTTLLRIEPSGSVGIGILNTRG